MLTNKIVPLQLCQPQNHTGTGLGLSRCIASIHDNMVMKIPECAYQYLNPSHPARGESLN